MEVVATRMSEPSANRARLYTLGMAVRVRVWNRYRVNPQGIGWRVDADADAIVRLQTERQVNVSTEA